MANRFIYLRLTNKNNLVTQITNYGGRVVSLWVPDKFGNFEDIVWAMIR